MLSASWKAPLRVRVAVPITRDPTFAWTVTLAPGAERSVIFSFPVLRSVLSEAVFATVADVSAFFGAAVAVGLGAGGSAGMITVKSLRAGVGSTLPAASVAVTTTLCAPSLSPVSCSGLAHGAAAAPSTEHTNVAASVAVKANENSRVVRIGGGAHAMIVSGAVVSTVNVARAGVASTRAPGPTARTASVCAPSASPVSRSGLAHAVNGAESSEHWNVAPAAGDAKANSASARLSSASGTAVSCVSNGAAADADRRRRVVACPSASVATTVNGKSPSGRPRVGHR